ncbi:MAG: hypothetical protein HFH18_07290 [Ruminococcus sp.]|nr:hypothetical protein [Ruminococcus sp.]
MQQYYPIFDSWKSSYESFDIILSHIPESSPYQLLQMAASQEGSGRETEERRKLFVQCVETTESSYLKHQAVKEAILLRMELGEIVSAMDLEEWRQCAKKLQHLVGPEESETLKMAAEKLVQDVPVYGLWLKKLLCEKELIEGFLVGDVMLQTLKEYCRYVLRFYQIQYRDEMFSREKRILLPKDCRFALYVWEALDQLEAAEFPEAVRLFRKALRFYPSMTGTIREIIRLISRKAETPAQNTGDEFRMLAQQMKESLQSMINSKQYTQAMSVILQLSPLLPEDLELLRMRQNLLRKMAESNTPQQS